MNSNQQAYQRPAAACLPPPRRLLQRKCACGTHSAGEQTCANCRREEAGLQRSLRLGASDHPLEAEADRVADQVLAAHGSTAVHAARPHIQRASQAQADGLPAVPGSVGQALAEAGRPIEPALRSDMERRFDRDFSHVRVHAGSTAERSAADVDARAYTVGRDIVFGANAYAPATSQGRHLIAHELAHVVQQTGADAAVVRRDTGSGSADKAEEKPSPKFSGCSKEQQAAIADAIDEAEDLVTRAVHALQREFPLTAESKAMREHLGDIGDSQKATLIERYKGILATLHGKTYNCAARPKKAREGGKLVDLCGEARCPGTEISLFPDFGKPSCPAGPVLLHEAAHNAGACHDIDLGAGYPPPNPEDNAYSLERFASAVKAGPKAEPELKKRDSIAPR